MSGHKDCHEFRFSIKILISVSNENPSTESGTWLKYHRQIKNFTTSFHWLKKLWNFSQILTNFDKSVSIWLKFWVVIVGGEWCYHKLSKLSKSVKIVKNCQNCQKHSKIVKTLKNCPNYQKLSKLSKIVRIVEVVENCQKWSKCWSGHVSSSLWSNVSKVTSL